MCECLKREGGWWMDECCAHIAEAWHNGKLPSPMEWEQAKARLEKLDAMRLKYEKIKTKAALLVRLLDGACLTGPPIDGLRWAIEAAEEAEREEG